MKKLLLILICLVVSFDVRSKESLTRLKLLCDYENYSEGFDFLDTETTKDWVNIIFLNKKTGNLSFHLGTYFTNSSEISIFTMDEPGRKIKNLIDKILNPVRNFLVTSNYFTSKKKRDEINKKLKSNQKSSK